MANRTDIQITCHDDCNGGVTYHSTLYRLTAASPFFAMFHEIATYILYFFIV